MRVTVYVLSFLFIGLPVLGLSFLLLIHSGTALVADTGKPLSHENVKRIKKIIEHNLPRGARQRHFKLVELREDELNLAARYGLRRVIPGNVVLKLEYQHIGIRATLLSPLTIFGAYINLEGDVRVDDLMTVEITHLKVGKLDVPAWLLKHVLDYTHRYTAQRYEEYRAALSSLRNLRVRPDKIVLTYEWQPELFRRLQDRGQDLLISPALRARVIAHSNELAKITRAQRSKKISVTALIQPMFVFALQRSLKNNLAVEENKALLLALSVYAQGFYLKRYLPPKKDERIVLPAYHRYLLSERHDLYQHYFVSAGLTVAAGMGLADAIGVAKEISDSMGGSGFSFADLIADRSGVSFAELATRDEKSALAVQQFMANENLAEKDFMPAITDLPEGLNEKTFKQRYKNVGSVEYQQLQNIIEERIRETRIFRGLN